MIHTTLHEGGITVVRPGAERLTAVNAVAFKTDVCDLVAAGSSQLVIDFEEVSFLDSSGLGALVGILKKVGHRGEVAVCGLGEDLGHMFRISHMDKVFTAFPNAETAVSTINERA